MATDYVQRLLEEEHRKFSCLAATTNNHGIPTDYGYVVYYAAGLKCKLWTLLDREHFGDCRRCALFSLSPSIAFFEVGLGTFQIRPHTL